MTKTKCSNGIFVTVAETIRGPAAIARAFQAAMKRWTLEAMVTEIENEARRILKTHDVKPHRIPEGSPSIVWDAEIAICHAEGLRQHVREGNAEAAAVAGIALGREGLRLQVRPHERAARIGRVRLENLGKGQKSGIDRYADARERHKQWIAMAESMHGTARGIALRIARECNANPETIRKALRKNPRK